MNVQTEELQRGKDTTIVWGLVAVLFDWKWTALAFLVLGLFGGPILISVGRVWFGLGNLLARIVSPIVLAALYFFILVPWSMIYRIFHPDVLSLERTFSLRKEEHRYTEMDFKHPY